MCADCRMLFDAPRRNEQERPHMVEIQVPGDGLGDRLNDMHDWHKARLLEARRGHGRTDVEDREIVSYMRWCFKDPQDAEDFRLAFGGALVTPERSSKSRFWAS
jgi:hypothetical protein